MKWLLAVMLLLLGGCAHLPDIQTVNADRRPAMEKDCRAHFPQGRWQLVHTIFARFDGGRQATFTGALVFSNLEKTIHCVLMTLEGMVLFDARHDGQTTVVQRAFGPFESSPFAQGVMADIRFLFFRPEGNLIAAGMTRDDRPVCRYQGPDGTIVDLVELADGGWRMQQYDDHARVMRRVTADRADSNAISPRMVIDAGRGHRAYHLSMNLVEAVKRP